MKPLPTPKLAALTRPVVKPKELPIFRPAPDPLKNVKYTGDLQQDVDAEMSALSDGFRQRMQREQKRVNDELDSENWVNIAFETRAQKEEFLRKAGFIGLGDKYLDGRDVAKALGIDLVPSGRVFRPEPKIDQAYADLAVPLKST